jgi:MFS family permease
MVVQLTAVVAGTVVATASPRIASELHGLSLFPWIFSAYGLATAATSPVVGKLSDLVGRRPFYVLGMILFGAGALGSAFSANMPEMVAARAVAGIGGGAMAALTGLTVGDLFPPRQRARWLAATVGVYGAGSLVGPWAGGLVTDAVGWRWIFAGSVVPPLVATLVMAPVLPSGRRIRSASIDLAGVGFFVASVVALLFVIALGEQEGALSAVTLGIGVLAVAAFAAMIVRERRVATPLISLPMFTKPVFLVAILISFTLGIVFNGAIAYVPLYMQKVQGASASSSGLLLIPMMAPFVVGGVGFGQLMAHSGRYVGLARFGTAAVALGAMALWLAPPGLGQAFFLVGLGLTGLGAGGTFPLLSLVVQSSFPYRQMGAAHTLRQLFTSLSGAVGIPLLGVFVFLGDNLNATGISHVFMASSALALVTLLMAFRLPTITLRSSFEGGETESVRA